MPNCPHIVTSPRPPSRGEIEMVRIPSGNFMMGSPGNDSWAYPDEGPQNVVALAAFELARTPVTNAQYHEYLAANPGARRPEYWASTKYGNPNQPVVGVSWEEAMAFCQWAGLTLPTEAQWEYACRAGTMTRYHSGNTEEDLARVGWYDGNSDGLLHAVAELEPNAFGLYDMHGNVREWCLDGAKVEDGMLEAYSVRSPRSGDGLREATGSMRIVRGGWHALSEGAREARSACRGSVWAGYHGIDLGFRPARVLCP